MSNKETLLAVALNYLARGWSVIPVGKDKIPCVSWKEFQSRRATSEEVVKWFEQFPDMQIGVVTGSVSDLTVIDVEVDGDFDLIKDETLTVKTGGGGKHYYFKYDQDFTNAVRILPSIDVRSEGGYVFAVGESSKGSYGVLKDIQVTQMSQKTKTLLLEAKMTQKQVSPGGIWSHPHQVLSPNLDYPGYGAGQRNDEMTRYVGAVLARIHPTLWETVAWEMIKSANQKNKPPLPEREIRSTFDSVKSREARQNPNGRSWGQNLSQTRSYGQNFGPGEASQPQAPDKKAVILHASEVAELQVIDSDHTFATGMKPFDDALLGGFSAGDLIVVSGKSGVGKTTLIQDWSVTLAMGGNNSYEKLPALWFSYEVLAKPLWMKFQKIGANKETPIFLPSYNESGNSEWVVEMIKTGIKDKGIKVVAIDHLGFLRAPRGNYANQADAITHTVRNLKRLAVEDGLIIILPVHVRKTKGKVLDIDDIKDSIGIVQEADTVFFIDRLRNDSGVPTEQAKLWLSKNRKTGTAVSGIFDFKFGRYFYNEAASREEGLVDEQKRDAEETAKRDWEILDKVKKKIESKKDEQQKDKDNASGPGGGF